MKFMLYFFKKRFALFLNYVFVSVYMKGSVGACGGQKRDPENLELEHMWLWLPEAISPAQRSFIYEPWHGSPFTWVFFK